MRFAWLALTLILAACSGSQESSDSLKALRQLAAQPSDGFLAIRQRAPIAGLRAEIASYRVDDLEVHGLLLHPAGTQPAGGWPVLVMNHGYVPTPADYGLRKQTGELDRPGDYYRGLPLAYARQGLLVFLPDYRGHATSQGEDYLQKDHPTRWYSRDVIAAVNSLQSLPQANLDRLYLWGHSMGGAITLNAVHALGERVRAASLWSAARSTLAPLEDTVASQAFFSAISARVNIHHADDDPVTDFRYSAEVAAQLSPPQVEFFSYESEDHLFTADDLKLAIQRDIDLFLD